MIDHLDTDALVKLLNGLKEAIWCREPTGRMLFMNRAFEELLGVTRVELLADRRAYLRHIAEEHRASVVAAGEAAVERRVEVEFDLRVPGREPQRVRAHVSPLHGGSGRAVAVAGVAEDVTSEARTREWRERLVRAESERERAREEEADLRSILDRITDGFFAIDREWRLMYVNRRFEELLGVKRDDVIGESLFDRFPGFRGSSFHQMYRAALRDDRTVWFEEQWEPLSLWLDVHAYPSAEGLSVFFRDITERRELEFELMEARARERQRVGAELHDSVGQKLTGAALLTRALQARAEAGQPVPVAEVTAIGDVLDGLIAETRRISRGLFPMELQGESLAAALDEMASDVEDLFGVRCTVRASARTTLAPETELHLFRIAQELITNAVKHADARRLAVTLQRTGDNLELKLEHDGHRGGCEQSGRNGLGLRSLEYRVRAIDASLHTESAPEGWIGIACRLPL